MTQERIDKAINIAIAYGGIDGGRHKAWVIDQMVRALTGCPIVSKIAYDVNEVEYSYAEYGENEEYLTLIKEACDGEDGPNTYEWNTGIIP